MRCEACQGEGWRRRLIPHPYAPGHEVSVSRPCTFCQGKGTVQEVLAPSGKDFSANDTGKKELSFSS
jgi:DnaJ-class molecular chaperone